MKSILAQEEITDKEVKAFLDETSSEVAIIKNRSFERSNNPILEKAVDDANSLFNFCNTVSVKLGGGKAPTSEEKTKLKEMLLSVKLNIERGVIEGVTTGIDSYIKRLED